MEKKIDIKAAVSFGWTKFKENWQFLLVAGIILYGGAGLLRLLVVKYFGDLQPTFALLNFLINVAMIWLYFNILRALVGIVDSRPPKIADLFVYDPSVWSYFIASILYGIVVAAGFILFIIPGIYLCLRYGLYLYAIADKKLGPIEALRESSRLTSGVKWQILLFDIVCVGLVIAGVIAVVVGVFVAVPVIALATVFIYRELTNQTVEPVPVSVAAPISPATPSPATPQAPVA